MAKVGGLVFLDGKETGETRQCVHCGRHWIWVKGSGKKRGWCMNCEGITCGNNECHVCMHFLKKLDLLEKGSIKNL